VLATAGAFGMYQLFNFIGNQQIIKSYEDQGNLTYRKINSDLFTAGGDLERSLGYPDNKTEA